MNEDIIATTIKDILAIFINFSVKKLPIVSERKILGFIVKDMIIRNSNIPGFLDLGFMKNLSQLVTNEKVDDYFRYIENSNIESVPVLNSEDFNILQYKKDDFLKEYNPITRLMVDDYKIILDDIDFPILITNIKKEILYYNNKFNSYRLHFYLDENILNKHISEILGKNILKNFEIENENNVFSNRVNNFQIKYKINKLSLPYGNVYILYFY